MDTVYIPSYNRSKTISTHKHFQRCGMKNWFYVVEPHDYADYVKALAEDGIEDPERHLLMFDVDIYKTPYHEYNNPKGFKYEDEHGWKDGLTTGPGPARNALIDFARERGEDAAWMLDDDLVGFGVDAFYFQRGVYAHQEERINIVEVFELYERLLDKYENIGLAEFEKFGMSLNHKKNRHFSLSKTYTCIRINTTIDIPWRARWNDDVVYSLDYLWRGYVNLSSKIIAYQTPDTQSQDGGMTQEFQAEEDEIFEVMALRNAPSFEEIKRSKYQGTLAKARVPEALFPAVAEAVWKYNRPHHEIYYERIPRELILKDGANLDDLMLFAAIPKS
ncbi:hypothetical protein G7067_05215 [Leucobacter insecticola]|uniref:TET-Associated Glycosyltransferase domain-containing protein n=1 Tax=Leucobacter insecticola TaxID=2714934 RepID=A0A6G8FI33_9MICO|nr:hypothetical protein [Leucobacter insecticola]QIM15953.1 hypothetical protein G7067_05215 [Leucobacter insecticola]